jgi:asparagine synthase (glutamine-hydrolysing)
MFKYIGLSWIQSDCEQSATARALAGALDRSQAGWCKVLDAPGMIVWCAGMTTGANTYYRLGASEGVIVGRIFARDSIVGSPSVAVSATEAERIIETRGQDLVERYWGRYIAFWRAPNGNGYVLRDPSGTLPCYVTKLRGVEVYFSWLEDCLDLGLSFTIDWDHVALLLALAVVESTATSLCEVSQLYPGERIETNRARAGVDLAWNPGHFARSAQIADGAEAAQALRSTVINCVRQWASCYDSIVHRMSGGIDSTIVLGCLKDWPERPNITGLVHFLPGSRTDETPFARIAARFADCRLVECERPSQVDLEPLLRMHPLPASYSCLPYTQNDGVERRVAAAAGASAVFSGGSGDQVFYQSRADLAVSDYVARHGVLRPELWSTAVSAARLEKRSVWDILGAAIRDSRSKIRWEPVSEAGKHWPILHADLVASVRGTPRIAHPWLESARDTPIGKQWHVYSLTAPPTYYDARCLPSDPEYVHPLQSQPILEMSLQIPTYLLTNHGWDRWLARKAFAKEMPPEIATRRSKCALDDHLERVVERNLPFIRRFLLDGLLVQRGFLDKQKLDDVLSRRLTCPQSPTVEILQYVSVESWARTWTSARRREAA